MIAIWGNKEHLTCVFPLWFSHDGPKSSKNVPKPSKIPSLLSAQAGIYIYLTVYNTSGHIYEDLTKIPKSNISNILLNNTKKRWSGRASSLFSLLSSLSSLLSPLFSLLSSLFSRNVCPSCTKPYFSAKHRKPHAWIREQLSKSAHLPDPTHAGTKYPVRGNPSLRRAASWVRRPCREAAS